MTKIQTVGDLRHVTQNLPDSAGISFCTPASLPYLSTDTYEVIAAPKGETPGVVLIARKPSWEA